MIAHQLSVLANRRNVGHDPVEAAIFAPVLDDAAPRTSRFEVMPQIGKRFGRHVRVAHYIVRLPDHFLASVVADPGKGVIGLDNDALEVGTRVNEFTFGQKRFNVGNRHVYFHCFLSSFG